MQGDQALGHFAAVGLAGPDLGAPRAGLASELKEELQAREREENRHKKDLDELKSASASQVPRGCVFKSAGRCFMFAPPGHREAPGGCWGAPRVASVLASDRPG